MREVSEWLSVCLFLCPFPHLEVGKWATERPERHIATFTLTSWPWRPHWSTTNIQGRLMDCTWWLVCALLPAAVTFYKPGREPTIRLLPSFNCRVLTGRDDSKEEGKKPISGPQKNTKRPHWKVKKMITYLCPRIWGVLKTFNPQIQGHWRLSSLLLFLSSYYRQLVGQRLGSCGQEVKEDTRLTIIRRRMTFNL